MLLRSIRSRLLGLVLATVVPFTALIGVGLWNQWRSDQAAAAERATHEARLLAAQVDDHINNLVNLLIGLSGAVSWNEADTGSNDALLHKVKDELPKFISAIRIFALDGRNIGSSMDKASNHFPVPDRGYFQQVLAGQRLSIGDVNRARPGGQWVVTVARPVEDQAGRMRAVLHHRHLA